MDSRPVNLNLFTIHFPITAIVSILHRLSGLVLFLFIPFGLWIFHQSLQSSAQSEAIQAVCSHWLVKFLITFLLSAVVYHVFSGIRHLLMDLGLAEDIKSARITAYLVLFLSVSGSLGIGYCLWL